MSYICIMADKIGRVIILDGTINESFVNRDLLSVNNEYVESDKPTLLVGFEKTKELFKDISIFDKKINDNLYWTFNNQERKGEFRDDLEIFTSELFNMITKNTKYVFIDIIINNIKKYGDLLEYGTCNKWDTIYRYDMFLYLYNYCYDTIYGLDLKYMEELGIDITSFIEFIKGHTPKYHEESFEDSGYLKTNMGRFDRSISPKFLSVLLHKDN